MVPPLTWEVLTMPWVKYDKTNLTTMSEAARLCGMSESWFWHWVKEEKAVEAPSVKVGERMFYAAEQVDKVIKQVTDLRKQGRIG
jgi:predicted DNA-binding transcriptional regulator AlpA